MKIYNMEKIHKGIKNPPIEFIKVLQERLSYDPDTGIITWKNGINTGKEAGSITTTFVRKYDNAKHSVRQIYIGGYVLLGHRVAWAMYYGSFPNNIIDHIDNDSLNNRIENLRDVTSWENSMNRRIPSGRNQHGVKNVHVYDGRRKMYGVVIRGKSSKGKGSGLEIRKQFYRLRHAIEFRNKELKKLNLPYEGIDRNEWLTDKPIHHVKLDKKKKAYIPKHIRELQYRELIEVASTGEYTCQDLMKKFNICHATVKRVTKGIKLPLVLKTYDKEKMAELAKTGEYTLHELADIFDVNFKTISKELTKRKIKAKRKNHKKYEHTEKYYRGRPWLSQQ